MAKYGFYIYSAYAVVGLSLLGLIVREIVSYKYLKNELKKLENDT